MISLNAISPERTPISADAPDWDRECPAKFWDPGRKLLKSIRKYQKINSKSGVWSRIYCKLIIARYHFWSAVAGAEIPLSCSIGGGLLIPHPNGIVIHPDAIIGVNCLIFQQVTIGTRGDLRAPVIEGHVDIGAGAKILGGIRIGMNSIIGANAVVVGDVPSGATVAGIPAKLIALTNKQGE